MAGVVIIGGGQGAFSCASTLSDLGFSETITILERSSNFPYARPPLSKSFLTDDVTIDDLLLAPKDYYAPSGIQVITDAEVVGLDQGTRHVHLRNGDHLEYETLVIASGATPRSLPPARDYSNVFQLGCVEDAMRLRQGFTHARSVVVLGGGFIGLELASVARSLGLDVTVLEAAERILSRAVSPLMARIIYQRHTAQGVRVVTNALPLEFHARDDGRAFIRTPDQDYHPDIIIIGIGSVPNTSFVPKQLLYDNSGSLYVDGTLRTRDPHIFAIGDVASFPFQGQHVRLESVQNAVDQGRHLAAVLMNSTTEDYGKVPWFWTEQHGDKVQIVGVPSFADTHTVDPSTETDVYSWTRDRLTAVETINNPTTHALARASLGKNITIHQQLLAEHHYDLRSVVRGETQEVRA